MKTRRTALLIRCSVADAREIRWRAQREHRTISGYILNIASRSLRFEEMIADMLEPNQNVARIPAGLKRAARQTALLLRCSTKEAARIRDAAKRRRTTIGGFVLHCLRRSWTVASAKPPELAESQLN